MNDFNRLVYDIDVFHAAASAFRSLTDIPGYSFLFTKKS